MSGNAGKERKPVRIALIRRHTDDILAIFDNAKNQPGKNPTEEDWKKVKASIEFLETAVRDFNNFEITRKVPRIFEMVERLGVFESARKRNGATE